MTIASLGGAVGRIASLVVFMASPVLAFNEATHALINTEAGQVGALDELLKGRLGLIQGLGTLFTNREGAIKNVTGWLGEGGIREDQGNFGDFLFLRGRLLRHFHDPLATWDTAGLQTLIPPRQFESSVRWMQRADQTSQAVGGKRASINNIYT